MSDSIIRLIVELFVHILHTQPDRVTRVLDTLPGADATREAMRKRRLV